MPFRSTKAGKGRCSVKRSDVKVLGSLPDFHRSVLAAGEATGELNAMLLLLAESLEADFRFRWELFRELFFKGLFMVGNFIVWPLVVFWYTKSYILMFLLIGIILFVVLSIVGCYALSRIFKQVRPIYDAILAKTPGLSEWQTAWPFRVLQNTRHALHGRHTDFYCRRVCGRCVW